MPAYTKNMNLEKRSVGEHHSVEVLNSNFDKIDEFVPSIKSITLPVASWVEDTENGWWTQPITDETIVDGMKVDITFDSTNLKQLISDKASIIIRNNSGAVTAYSFNGVPTTDITGLIELRRVAI